MVKALFILLLASAIFGGAYWVTDELYLKPQRALEAEKQRGPEPPPPDPTLREFRAAVEIQKSKPPLEGRAALEDFVARYPESTRIDEARDLLGEVNADLLFSQTPAPEKITYLVKSGDVLNRVAMRTKTTPELIMRSNNLSGTLLRIGQKLVVTPADFSMVISPKRQMVTLYNGKRFFKQYRIKALPPAPKKGAAPATAPRRAGKVVDRIATDDAGNRVNFQDKEYALASHKVSVSIPGHSLYSLPREPGGKPDKLAQNGFGLAVEDLQEIVVLLAKNDPVTVE